MTADRKLEMLAEAVTQTLVQAVAKTRPADSYDLGPMHCARLSIITEQVIKARFHGVLEALVKTGESFNWNQAMVDQTMRNECAAMAREVWARFAGKGN